MFFNKSAVNEKTSNRKYGWLLEGIIYGVTHPLKRLERWSVLSALTVNRYLSYFILEGFITAIVFKAFIEEQVLLYYSLCLGL